MWLLLSVRSRVPNVNLCRPHLAGWLWRHLSRVFPDALAGVVMPDHLHLVVAATPDVARRLKWLLAQFAHQNFALRGCWDEVDCSVLTSREKLERNVRYVVLNPCRKQLVRDPLEWPWSTHRGVMGCERQPWVNADRLAGELGVPVAGFLERHHAYVSQDASVRPEGTPLPQLAPSTELSQFPLGTVLLAAAVATRGVPSDVRRRTATRRLFLHLSHDQGFRGKVQLATIAGVRPKTLTRTLAEPLLAVDLEAARRCLGDGRLRRVLPWEEQLASLRTSPNGPFAAILGPAST